MEGIRNEGLFHGKGAAERFRVNPKTIYKQLWAKVIPAYKVGQQWRIVKKDINKIHQDQD